MKFYKVIKNKIIWRNLCRKKYFNNFLYDNFGSFYSFAHEEFLKNNGIIMSKKNTSKNGKNLSEDKIEEIDGNYKLGVLYYKQGKYQLSEKYLKLVAENGMEEIKEKLEELLKITH